MRSVIERIVKRRILLSPDSRVVSETLLRELVWGRYINDQEVSEELIAKVKRAVVRSFIFILFTKVFFALAVEGTFENIFYGSIQWLSLSVNTAIPPLLMAGVGFILPTPGKENSEQILAGIKTILFESTPHLGEPFKLQKALEKKDPGLYTVFTILWMLTYLLSFGALILLLSWLGFTLVSQIIFLFFIAVVSFLSYRIGLLSRTYVVGERQGWLTPLVDFFFMPIVRVGRDLTEGISQINVILFIFDFIIETPFKGMFGFLEQWFLFIHAKRENLE